MKTITKTLNQVAEDYANKEVLVYLGLHPFPKGFDKDKATRLMNLFFNQSKKDFIAGFNAQEQIKNRSMPAGKDELKKV